MRDSLRRTALVAGLFVLAGCGGGAAGGPGGGGGGRGFPPTEVSIVTVAPVSAPVTFDFAAAVIPYRRVEVRPRVEGIITERPYTEGQVVKVGDLLYRIEPAKYEAAFKAAQVRLDAAKLRMERYAPLLAQNAVAKQDVDNARTEVEASQAALAQAKRDFDDTFVRAELAGRVGRTMLEVGARVSGSNDLLTTIDRLDPVYVSFRPSSQEMLEWSKDPNARELIRPGSALAVEAVLPDGSTLPRTGKLDFVAPSLDIATGTQEFRAIFQNPDGLLVPGQFVRARLKGFREVGALEVPVRAVQTAVGRQFVLVVAGGDSVQLRDVTTGQWSGDQWIISKGLVAGDRVIVDGIQKVGPGRVVKPVLLGAAPADGRGAAPGAAPGSKKAEKSK